MAKGRDAHRGLARRSPSRAPVERHSRGQRSQPHRPLLRNDPHQYDELAGEWWKPDGAFAMLHWIAKERAALVPLATRPAPVLLDLGCGGGLLAPYVQPAGYRHVGVDISTSALELAQEHGVVCARADVTRLPFPDASFDVVVAGEILEHVVDHAGTLAEACRVLRPGGHLVLDTIANTRRARLVAVWLAERIPRWAPRGIHDPKLFVDRQELVASCARCGVRVTLSGLRPSLRQVLRPTVANRHRMVSSRSTAILFQGLGRKT